MCLLWRPSWELCTVLRCAREMVSGSSLKWGPGVYFRRISLLAVDFIIVLSTLNLRKSSFSATPVYHWRSASSSFLVSSSYVVTDFPGLMLQSFFYNDQKRHKRVIFSDLKSTECWTWMTLHSIFIIVLPASLDTFVIVFRTNRG